MRERELLASLGAAAAAYGLTQSLVAPALPEIQRAFGATTVTATWVLTAFLLLGAVTTPVVGRLGDMLGARWLLLGVLAVVGAGTVITAAAPTIEVLIAGRALQGVGAAVFPLSFALLRAQLPAARVPGAIALLAAVLSVAAGFGTALAGPISDVSLRLMLACPLLPVAVAVAGVLLRIAETPPRRRARIDWPGAALLALWLAMLLLGIGQAAAWGWGSPRTVALLAGATTAATLWASFEQRVREPVVQLRMLRLRGVWTTNAAAVLVGFNVFTHAVLIPQFVQASGGGFGFGASVAEVGLYMLPTLGGMLAASLAASAFAARVGSRPIVLVGAVFTLAAFALLTVAHDQPWHFYAASGLQGVGAGCAYASLSNLIVEAVSHAETGVATGLNLVLRAVGGALGSQVAASIIAAAALTVDGAATERGFTVAFAVSAAVAAASLTVALLIPR